MQEHEAAVMADEESQLPPHSSSSSSPTSPSLSSSSHNRRYDSVMATSPITPTGSPSPDTYPSEGSPLLPPQIAGHGPRRRVRSRQTIPTWAGLIIVVGVLVWTSWLAMFVVKVLWKGRRGRKEDDGFGGWL
ncbi:hypothetical protein K504DRAFT_463076 [Pleomassaria siparia CBS 279.74]|uniref:Uncharacterized protein n=1 Tax=Pleomassaria siparia CBS 279.74 TaxID=1314801 RepID=A0A6G1JU25_9PLEO|nr:hypothetical protein K504DRAFT_463076 [Pleomassaria siparia CBS 279.74]